MRRAVSILFFLALVGAVGYGGWWYTHRVHGTTELALYGNIDLRQIELAFNNSERISKILVQEGDRVKGGQLVAQLDTSRMLPQVAQAEAQVAQGEAQVVQGQAQVAALRSVLEKLRNGSRPEEIAQARANVAALQAEQDRARLQLERNQKLFATSGGKMPTSQDLEDLSAALKVSSAKLDAAQKQLDLAIAGPRKEDIAQAEAQLRAGEAQLLAGEAQLRGGKAQLALLRQQLKDAELFSPADAVVRTRIMEPGEIAFPQKPVLSLAKTDPKWVRAYISEVHLGRIHPGMRVSVAVDSFPGRLFDAWIGFISPVAEFTPKAVQTEDLRTSLVYEVRAFVVDPKDELRLGMPASVYLRPVSSATGATSAPENSSSIPIPASEPSS